MTNRENALNQIVAHLIEIIVDPKPHSPSFINRFLVTKLYPSAFRMPAHCSYSLSAHAVNGIMVLDNWRLYLAENHTWSSYSLLSQPATRVLRNAVAGDDSS